MDWQPLSTEWKRGPSVEAGKRWVSHAGHEAVATPHRPHVFKCRTEGMRTVSSRLVTLDGSKGEGGGQILRTALTLSLLTGRPFRILRIRANRDKPGLRPQHVSAVQAAAELSGAEVVGASPGSRDLTFRPAPYEPRDLEIHIGTAGATALVLQTLHLPLALRAQESIRVVLSGGTFNLAAPSFPFLETTWRSWLTTLGAPLALAMPTAGFYPRGGGRIEAWIEPASLRPITHRERGALLGIRGAAGIANLRPDIAERMRGRALARLDDRGLRAEIDLVEWPTSGQGAAISLTAEHAHGAPATFVGLGERGKPSEVVADEAILELFAFLDREDGVVDPHSADQILVPLALAPGRSEFTVSEVTEHLRTNANTLRTFLDRSISLEEPDEHRPGRVVID